MQNGHRLLTAVKSRLDIASQDLLVHIIVLEVGLLFICITVFFTFRFFCIFDLRRFIFHTHGFLDFLLEVRRKFTLQLYFHFHFFLLFDAHVVTMRMSLNGLFVLLLKIILLKHRLYKSLIRFSYCHLFFTVDRSLQIRNEFQDQVCGLISESDGGKRFLLEFFHLCILDHVFGPLLSSLREIMCNLLDLIHLLSLFIAILNPLK